MGWKDRTINHRCFDGFETEGAQYWAGMLAADGWIASRGGGSRYIGLSLSNEDSPHVQSFLNFVESSLVAHRYETGGGYCLKTTISSVQIGSTLVEAGIRPGKSYNLEIANDTLVNSRHFWRGFCDGDGSLSIMKRNQYRTKQPLLQIFGTLEVCNAFTDFLERQLGVNINANKHSRRKDGNEFLWRVVTTYSTAVRVARLLYDDSTYALPRKKRIADEIISQFNDKRGYISPLKMKTKMSPSLIREIQVLKDGGMTIREICNKLEVTKGQVSNAIYGYKRLSRHDAMELESDYDKNKSKFMLPRRKKRKSAS